MPETAVAEPLADGSARGSITEHRNPGNGQFAVGNTFGHGRPKGSKNAAKCLDRAAPRLARRMIERSFKSDHVLCKTMDKILPDAGKDSSDGQVVPIFVIVSPRSDVADGAGALSAVADGGAKQGEDGLVLDADPAAGTEHG